MKEISTVIYYQAENHWSQAFELQSQSRLFHTSKNTCSSHIWGFKRIYPLKGRERRNKPATFNHAPVAVTFWWRWLSDNITGKNLSCPSSRCCFGNSNYGQSNICMLSNFHPTMVYALCHAVILHLGLHSKCKVILWKREH